MVIATVNVTVVKDTSEIPTGIDVNIVGLPRNTWLALFLNDVKIARVRTDTSGSLIETFSPIPSEYHKYLYFISSFGRRIGNNTTIPSTGVIAGQACVVEDTFNDGVSEFPATGTFTFELRYD